MKTKSILLFLGALLVLSFNITLFAQEEETEQELKPEVKQQGIKAYSKYDFTPGEQVMFFENFESDAIGDFPARWNTNGSGEVVTLEGFEGKWFKMAPEGIFFPEALNQFPENFTLEFDLVFQRADESTDCDFPIEIISWIDGEDMNALVPGNGGGAFTLKSSEITAFNWANQEYGEINSSQSTDIITQSANSAVIKISIWVQKQRARLYVNEKKVYDIPKFLPAGFPIGRIRFSTYGHTEENVYYLTNMRMASGKPDIRSKLLTEGKLVTYGIYFDSGSDKVKPESYGTLKMIADILVSEPSLSVKIIGHTDSDGDDAKNLNLSKRRGASVKKSLTADFGIADSRIETDGKGESEPVAPNTTSEGKASNRRVEIIKL
jgi:outer membrane protein OmpA-like peptidoglycan-associated protein